MEHPMNRPLREALIQHHKSVATELERITPSCTTCEHMQAGCCAANADQPIPKEFQAVGCDAWSYDCIPF